MGSSFFDGEGIPVVTFSKCGGHRALSLSFVITQRYIAQSWAGIYKHFGERYIAESWAGIHKHLGERYIAESWAGIYKHLVERYIAQS